MGTLLLVVLFTSATAGATTPDIEAATAVPTATQSSPQSVEPSAGEPAVVNLGEYRSGSTVEVPAGTFLEVALAGNASTGFRWAFIDSGEGVVIDTGRRRVALDEPRRIGSGGVETRRLQAVRPGRQIVVFEYRRPWQTGGAPARTVSWTILVTD